MPRQQKPMHLYSVHVTSYADVGIKERVERGEEHIISPEQLTSESFYFGTSEAKARTTFYRAVQQAMKNPLAIHVTVYRGNTPMLRVKPDRTQETFE